MQPKICWRTHRNLPDRTWLFLPGLSRNNIPVIPPFRSKSGRIGVWGPFRRCRAVITHFMQGFITLTVRSAKLTVTTLEAGWSKVKSASYASDPNMRLLFVHQNFGAFGGAETNIQITADELAQRGHTVALLHAAETGRSVEPWKQTFSTRFQLPASRRPDAVVSVLGSFAPDIIYLHPLPDVQVIEALLDSSVPVIRMVHDHSLYCPRSYKYNPLTRAICYRSASLYCAFPCMAPIARNRDGAFPLKWSHFAAHRRELELSKRCEAFFVYSEYSKAELANNCFPSEKIHLHVPMNCWSSGPTSSFSGRNLILSAGQIIRGKGVDLLLKALAKLTVPF